LRSLRLRRRGVHLGNPQIHGRAGAPERRRIPGQQPPRNLARVHGQQQRAGDQIQSDGGGKDHPELRSRSASITDCSATSRRRSRAAGSWCRSQRVLALLGARLAVEITQQQFGVNFFGFHGSYRSGGFTWWAELALNAFLEALVQPREPLINGVQANPHLMGGLVATVALEITQLQQQPCGLGCRGEAFPQRVNLGPGRTDGPAPPFRFQQFEDTLVSALVFATSAARGSPTSIPGTARSPRRW
jgi:hypothetical protein